jgi:hypothetical protein
MVEEAESLPPELETSPLRAAEFRFVSEPPAIWRAAPPKNYLVPYRWLSLTSDTSHCTR